MELAIDLILPVAYRSDVLFPTLENRCFQRHEPVDTDESCCGVNVAVVGVRLLPKVSWAEMLFATTVWAALSVAGHLTLTLHGRQ